VKKRSVLALFLSIAAAEAAAPSPSGTNAAPPSPSRHWAFHAPTRPNEPQVQHTEWPRNAIDKFILTRLEKEKLAPAPEADRLTLLRRLNFDLIGLPPSPQEAADFIADTRPEAYEQLVERLLASPHYGERWGRHWLDVAGYADSNGYFDADSDRPLAYKYRDYVVQAFNRDKPFDRFIREQIAGDELAGYTSQGDVTEDMIEPLTATHFLRNPPDGTGESDGNAAELRADRYAVLEGNVHLIGSAFLGLTVQCARCHNHKFEPLTQDEYYQLQAILKPVYDHDKWLKPAERFVAVGTRAEREEHKRRTDKFERELSALKEGLEGLSAPFRKLAQQEILEKFSEPLRNEIKKALETKEKQRSDAMKVLLKTNNVAAQFSEEELLKKFPPLAAASLPLKDAIKNKETERPKPLPQIAAVTDITPEPPPHHVLARGNYANPGREVPPGVPAILAGAFSDRGWALSTAEPPGSGPVSIGEGGPESAPSSQSQIANRKSQIPKSSGRRTALANWLTVADHPTVTRLLVNRIWQHHFGVGLVSTPDNFGLTGSRPTHPELLDWLATEFVRTGWSVKAMHRLIVTSATYRQVSSSEFRVSSSAGVTRNPKPETRNATDPDDHLLWQFPLQRLDAESIRDAMLAITGELDLKMGGPFVPKAKTEEGQYVVNETDSGAHRRSLYLQQRRTTPVTMLDVFDGAKMNPNCVQRGASTVPLQSLALLNSDFVRTRSKAFAKRVLAETGASTSARVARAFQLAVGRPPSGAEQSAADDFYEAQHRQYEDRADADQSLWTDFCQMLLASNSFLYVE
jgi:hypothetical protein